ncbi:MAG TPA: PAS domain-containing protein [Stellaceae bacterium]|nr:PAS domain-containing protein [Stellaceae bacterium]
MLDIKTPSLRHLYHDWQERRRGREFPSRSDFDVLDLGYIIGNLSLLDVFFQPLRFRFRLHASRVTERVGYEMTGKDLDILPARDSRETVWRHFVDVINRRVPIVQVRERQISDDRILPCEVLALPLARDGSTIDMLMSGLVWL